MVRVVIPSMMRDQTGGAEIVEVQGATLKEVIARLVEKHPGMKALLLDEEGQCHAHVAFFVDGVEARASEGLLTRVSPGAEVVIVPALSGGVEA